ncbi:MAG: type VI secretion system tube protein Hcp [Planctomycetota bacterium]|nr:type VI secretion system tube protein Hcp [Planctomycetota bacterium]
MAGYIKFDGIDGESEDTNHKGWSDVISFNQSFEKPCPPGATGVSRQRADTIPNDVLVVKKLDKASPKLSEAICKGKVFGSVKIELTRTYTDGNRVAYFKYELKNVLITHYGIGGAAQSADIPVEELRLNFEEIKVTYTIADAKGKSSGNVEYTWKVGEGKS